MDPRDKRKSLVDSYLASCDLNTHTALVVRPLVYSFFLVFAACGSDPASLSEWKASDHAQPSRPDESRVPAAEVPAPAPIDAAKRYATACATCHGAKGEGASAPALNGGVGLTQVVAALSEGRPGMPNFKQWSLSDRIAVARYVSKSLGAAGGAARKLSGEAGSAAETALPGDATGGKAAPAQP